MSLLDFLSSEEAQLGLGLLGAAGPRSDGAGFGQRLQEGMGYVQAQKDAKQKREFQQTQMDNYRSEIEARKLASVKDARQQAMIEGMFGGGQGAPGAPPQGGQPMPGGAPQGAAPNLVQLAKQLGIPEQAIQADMVFNGGKKISELLAERSRPNWQNVNGNLVNTNAQGFAGGLQGGMSSSADGKVTAWQPDGNGGVVVGAPRGAMETFGAYKGVEAGLGAAGRVNLRKNADGTESPVSELSENPLLQGMIGGRPAIGRQAPAGYATEPQMKTTVNGMAGDQAGNLAAILREIKTTQSDLMKPLDAESKALLRGHLESLQRQAADPRNAAQPGSAAVASSGAPAYGMTNDQATKVDAEKKYQDSRATARADIDNQDALKSKQFVDFRSQLNVAKSLLDTNPTASAPGALLDKVGGWMGANVPGAESAASLKTAAAWLVQNIPKAPGAQSEAELRDYKAAVGQVGDDTVPVAQRKAALKTAEGMINMWEGRAGGKSPAESAKPATTTFDAKPPAQNFKGKTATGPDGKRYKSDGLIWKEVQ